MRLSSGYEDRKARMEMISLMDVMFLILVVFVYSIFSMSVHRGLKVDLPAAKGVQQKGEQTIITLAADNRLLLNKQAMPLDELVIATVKLWRESATPVLISADKAASLGTGIELLGKLKNGGVERVAFQVSGEAK
ncbi:MAG TPA: biopolymer transporter ExbD [Kiritimatiellia bacterium]|nr:biopolymer transporter ExbD [Kiritimatiellia bacterium]HPS08227.1 biopolymer transporter ExbD [Kiritimatiellia bacterium]